MQEYIRLYGHGKLDHYFAVYEDIFRPFRDKPCRILEIGVLNGSSLRLWERYFLLAEIVGLDIEDKTESVFERAKLIIGDQEDEELLKSLGTFDIVIDDGGHTMAQHQTSLRVLFPQVNVGGWYCIEDLYTSCNYPIAERTTTLLYECLEGLHCGNNVLPGGVEYRFVRGLVAIRKGEQT